MLVASAASMRGGANYAVNLSVQTSVPILASPNTDQGFGRIDITDIVSSSPPKQYINQTTILRTQGDKWSATYQVADPTKPVKIALAWSDPPAPAWDGAETEIQTLLINNLDLTVYAGDGATCQNYIGNNVTVNDDLHGEEAIRYSTCSTPTRDWKNNVEKVLFFPSSEDENVNRFSVLVSVDSIGGRAVLTDPISGFNQDFALYVYNAYPATSLPAPTNLVASSLSPSSVLLTWQGVQGSAGYQVSRNSGGGFQVLASQHLGLSFSDANATPNTYYQYMVCAVDPAGQVAGCNADIAYPGSAFTDEPLVVGSTTVKAIHITELRARANALRQFAGLAAYSFSTAVSAGTTIRDVDMAELRAAIESARTQLGLASTNYTDPTLTPGQTLIRATHIAELRNATQ